MTTGKLLPSRVELLVALGTSLYAVSLAVATRVWTYDIWGALVVGPVLIGMSLPLLRRVAEKDGLAGLYPILVTALVVKVAMAVPRWAMAFVLYDGSADAGRYDADGKVLAESYRHLVFPFSTLAGGDGTKWVASITGGVYAVIGPSLLGGFVVFSWFGFWGMVAMYRAARLAIPDLDAKRYAHLVFFLPSMAFWPSSIGKEAVVSLGIGVGAYGAARMFTGRRWGAPAVAAGVVLCYLIRPHIAAMLALSFCLGFLLRPARRRTALTPLLKVIGILVIVGAGAFVVKSAAESLGVNDVASASNELSVRGENTDQGGSSFTAQPVSSPLDLPMAALTVLFRPLPWESPNLQGLIASAEGTGLLVAAFVCRRRLATGVRRLRQPYVAMAVLFLLGFVFAFSQFANFGILARQRVQALPFLLLFLCLPPPRSRPTPKLDPPLERAPAWSATP